MRFTIQTMLVKVSRKSSTGDKKKISAAIIPKMDDKRSGSSAGVISFLSSGRASRDDGLCARFGL
jgi:hypothetical protein